MLRPLCAFASFIVLYRIVLYIYIYIIYMCVCVCLLCCGYDVALYYE